MSPNQNRLRGCSGASAAPTVRVEVLEGRTFLSVTSPPTISAGLTPAAPTTVDSLPLVMSILVDDGTAQRSRVRSLTVPFDQPVGLEPGAFTLARLNTGGSGANDGSAPTDATAALGTPFSNDGGITWTIPILPGTEFSDAFGSLVDGIYSFTVHGSHVTVGGVPLQQDLTLAPFHRLFGDVNGNKIVNNADYVVLRSSLEKAAGDPAYQQALDYDGNGVVNNADYAQFRQRFLKSFTY